MKKILYLSFFLLLFSSLFFAAQVQTGSIRGVVQDDNGEVLPGATVTINSPSLMIKDYSVTTGSKGGFRFPALSPGTYELQVSLSGFQSIRRPNIIVSMNSTVTLNITLEPSPIEEEVVVTAPSPTVDLKNTNIGQNFKNEYLEQIPNARDLWTVIREAPNVVMTSYNVGGSESGEQTYFSAAGTSLRQNTYNIDGVNTTDMAGMGSSSTYYAYDSIEEIQISTFSHSAEIGPSGVSLNIMTKSGSNKLRGKAGIYYSHNSWQSDNITEELEAVGIDHGNPMDYYMDYSLSLGGPIIKDKLWFFALRAEQNIHRFVLGFEYEGEPYPAINDLGWWIGKLDWQITKKHKLSFNTHYNRKLIPNRYASYYRPPETTKKEDLRTPVYQLSLTSIFSDNVFMDLRIGASLMDWPEGPSEEAILDRWPIREYRTTGPDAPYSYGYHNNYYYYSEDQRDRYQAAGFLDVFIDDFLGGSHEIKFGFQAARFLSDKYRYSYGPRLGFRYGESYNIRTVNYPLTNKHNVDNLAFYVQDTYVLFNRLTLNLGLRLEMYEAYLPEQGNPESEYPYTYLAEIWDQTTPGALNYFTERNFDAVRDIVSFTNLSPRLGLIYDVFGDGKTALKFSYSRYYWQISNALADFVNPNTLAYAYFRWDDKNNDMMWQEGEEASKPYSYSITLANEINPNLKNTYTDEINFGIEREILKDFSLGASFIWRKDGNLIESIDTSIPYSEWNERTFLDLGEDGIEGTSDDGTFIAYEPNYRPDYESYVTNPEDDPRYTWPIKNSRYRGLSIRAHKKFSNNWQMLASFTWSKAEGMRDNPNYDGDLCDSPNEDLYAFGPTSWDRPIIFKLSGSYLLPLDISLGASIRYNSGAPYARMHETPRLSYINYVTVPVEKRGESRMPSVTLVDLRIEKNFKIPRKGFFPGGRLGFVADIFNVLNSNTALDMGNVTADNLGVIEEILAPRIFRIGAKFSF